MAKTNVKPKPAVFPTDPKSPFADQYDIVAERLALRDFAEAAELDTTDPRYSRFVELEEREAELDRMRTAHVVRQAADKEVPDSQALKVRDLGKLGDEEVDTMALHTLEASRLFIGRAIEPGRKGFGQAGGKKVGAALRTIWHLSANDNPYADYCLIQATERIRAARDLMTTATAEHLRRLEAKKLQGLRFSVLGSAAPMEVDLGFKSPYGYAVIMLINDYDFFVRVVKTLGRKDMLSDNEVYQQTYSMTRACRSLFEQVVYFQRYLLRDELRVLSRSDFLPSADDEARKRVQAVVGIFGELPREVFNGTLTPRHSRRRVNLSAAELRLLDEVPLTAEVMPETAASLV